MLILCYFMFPRSMECCYLFSSNRLLLVIRRFCVVRRIQKLFIIRNYYYSWRCGNGCVNSEFWWAIQKIIEFGQRRWRNEKQKEVKRTLTDNEVKVYMCSSLVSCWQEISNENSSFLIRNSTAKESNTLICNMSC